MRAYRGNCPKMEQWEKKNWKPQENTEDVLQGWVRDECVRVGTWQPLNGGASWLKLLAVFTGLLQRVLTSWDWLRAGVESWIMLDFVVRETQPGQPRLLGFLLISRTFVDKQSKQSLHLLVWRMVGQGCGPGPGWLSQTTYKERCRCNNLGFVVVELFDIVSRPRAAAALAGLHIPTNTHRKRLGWNDEVAQAVQTGKSFFCHLTDISWSRWETDFSISRGYGVCPMRASIAHQHISVSKLI